MQYRHEIGHALTNFAFAADTKRKTSVPLFFASTGGLRLPSFMPILHKSLQFIDVTVLLSTGFRQYRARIALLQTYYTSELVSSMVTVPRFEESELSGSVPDSMPILHWSVPHQ